MMLSGLNGVIGLIAALKFVFILDFLLPLPLGPDISAALGFEAAQLGWVAAAYTLASMLAGLGLARWLDQVPRKVTLLACLAVFCGATALTPFATDLQSLLLLRAITGFAGCPAVALAMAVLLDAVPLSQRGAALGKVMAAFSVAAVLGVPIALELARWGGWGTPFAVTAALGALIALATWRYLPGHVASQAADHAASQAAANVASSSTGFIALLRQPLIRRACCLQAANQFAAFLVVPHFSAFFLLNLGFPRDALGGLYLVGGLITFCVVQWAGRLADQYGPLRTVAAGCGVTAVGLLPLWLMEPVGLPGGIWFVLWVAPFAAFMAGNACRNVSVATLTTQAPAASQRASYMALESVVQDGAISLAALCASGVLLTGAAGELLRTPWLAALATATLGLVWLLTWRWHALISESTTADCGHPT